MRSFCKIQLLNSKPIYQLKFRLRFDFILTSSNIRIVCRQTKQKIKTQQNAIFVFHFFLGLRVCFDLLFLIHLKSQFTREHAAAERISLLNNCARFYELNFGGL